jgi:gamma-glutamyltranspeptidase / glutathione hydrolase
VNKLFALLLYSLILFGCGKNPVNKSLDILTGPGIITKNGMVVSAHPQSSKIGAEILLQEGNAIDAAVATGFALAVCYPEAGNIGGGGFMLIRTCDGNVTAIDFREKAPVNATRDMYLDSKRNVVKGLSTGTHLASGVPGSVYGMITVHSKYGKLPFMKVIQPAIDLAKNGFPVTSDQAESLNGNRKEFIKRNLKWPAFIKDSLWKKGDMLIQTDLASTLERIRDYGRDGFYSGKTAELILKEMNRGNGIITEQDLKDYKSVWRNPLSCTYKGYNIISICPPSSGGITLLQLLRMTAPYPIQDWGFHSIETIHLMVEAERRAFADRAEFLGDPDFVRIPVKALLNKDYLLDRMKTFNDKKASLSSEIGHGLPENYASEETTHYSVVDSTGNAVAVTTTLNGSFGNSIVVDGAGFLLNNEMDDFSIKPGFPNMYGLVGREANSIAPGKRMLSSMSPTIVEHDGKLFMVVGSPGGSTISTTVFQVIINVIDFKMNIQDAVNAGRFHHQWLPDSIFYERNSLDSIVLRKLKLMGHAVVGRSSIGRVNAIQIMTDGKKAGGADQRGDNTISGF